MRPESYSERRIEIEGWPVNITTYVLDGEWHAKADNVSPGATLARFVAGTREEAEKHVTDRAAELLARTKRREV